MAERRFLPNAFSAPPTGIPEAQLDYVLGDEAATFHWRAEGPEPPAELSFANVFDSLSGTLYVKEEHGIAYMPLGLDLLPKLADACVELKLRFEGQIARLPSRLPECPYLSTKHAYERVARSPFRRGGG